MVNSICSWIHSQLSAYVDGALRSDVALRVTDHLESCPNCRDRHREESELVMSAIHALVEAEPSAGFSSRLERVIASPLEATDLPEPTISQASRRRLPLAWAAAAAVILSLLWISYSFDSTPAVVENEKPVETKSVVTLEPTPLPPSRESTGSVVHLRRGDFDGDGDFTLADVELLGQYLRDANDLAGERLCPPAIDFDDDEELTLADLQLASRQLLGEAPQNLVLAFQPEQTQLICDVLTCPF